MGSLKTKAPKIRDINKRIYEKKGVIFMKTKFENFDVFKDQDPKSEKPFIFVMRDRAAKNEERFVATAMSEKEVKRIYECLGKYFN